MHGIMMRKKQIPSWKTDFNWNRPAGKSSESELEVDDVQMIMLLSIQNTCTRFQWFWEFVTACIFMAAH